MLSFGTHSGGVLNRNRGEHLCSQWECGPLSVSSSASDYTLELRATAEDASATPRRLRAPGLDICLFDGW